MIHLLPLPIVGRGTGQVKLVIHQGVPELRGLPQHLEGRYGLCGCESIPMYVFNGFGGACAVIGSLLALAFYRVAVRTKCAPEMMRSPPPRMGESY